MTPLPPADDFVAPDAGAIALAPRETSASAAKGANAARSRLAQALRYVAIARPHHYGKNVLVIVGSGLAFLHRPDTLSSDALLAIAWGLCATCLIASSNYVLNEILDASSDRYHAEKRHRPIAAGHILPKLALLEWFALGALGQWMAASMGSTFFVVAITFQLMAVAYNVRPLRLKDIPYLDVLSEAINSPLRLLLGWSIVLGSELPRPEIVLAFWTAGAWEMSRKRLTELRQFEDSASAVAYRKSFLHYNEKRLLVSMRVIAVSTFICCLLYGARLWPPEL